MGTMKNKKGNEEKGKTSGRPLHPRVASLETASLEPSCALSQQRGKREQREKGNLEHREERE